MDWKYKHFNQQATFKTSPLSVLEAARGVVAESLTGIEDTMDGFVARGYSGWNNETATFRFTSVSDGTQVAVELLVERAATRGYMLFDVGGFYNSQIDTWFLEISQRLGGGQEQVLVSKTTSSSRLVRGLLTGCLVYLIGGTCLVFIAIPLDQAVFRQSIGSGEGPFAILASLIGLLAGIAAFVYVTSPEASISKFIRARLQPTRNKEKR